MLSHARTWTDRSSLERTACAAVLLSALQRLHQVCSQMDLEQAGRRPTEVQYQVAMRNAQRAIELVAGSVA
jgi:hypothetical protein